MATREYYREYNIDELKELIPQIKEAVEIYTPEESIEDNLSKSDDRFRSNTWTEAYKYAAYYFDNPTLEDRNFHFNKFRFHFSDLLRSSTNPSEIPDMRNRTSFVGWVCKKHNQYLEKQDAEFRIDCSNIDKLLQAYGPNNENVRTTLGGIEYFY